MIEFVQGDMFATPADIRVNTVNCIGTMGAGMALAFKQRYPAMFREYQLACKAGEVRPGRLHHWKSLEGDWIINFPTKRDWRDPSRYDDIDTGLDALRDYLMPLGEVTVAVPALGCGHGGLDWSRVSGMIEQKLGNVAAHIRVFAPADSKRAGNKAANEPTSDEMNAAAALGYRRITSSDDRAFYASGRFDPGAERWIALIPSRQPGEREERALRSVAIELVRQYPDARVALVHSGRASEEIARLFADAGISTILIAPFGILTRKSLAKLAADRPAGAITILSWASPSLKWSRALFAEAMDRLRSHAVALLLSDPEPDWLLRRSEAWRELPISYLRYDGLPEALREKLRRVDAQPLGRRGDNGAPKLDSLLAPQSGRVPKREDPPAPLIVDLCDASAEAWANIIALIRQARPSRLQLSIQIDESGVAAALEEKLAHLIARYLEVDGQAPPQIAMSTKGRERV